LKKHRPRCRNRSEQLWQAAVGIARMLDFCSAGTIEFVGDDAGNFYFTEVKPRIQIEHGVTELISAVDIVREQIRAAAGEPLSVTQSDVQLHGHAVSCRITAEDPWAFLPRSAARVHGLAQ
jgi:acetyl/propionyl-CoA carboxylase alpha subunit